MFHNQENSDIIVKAHAKNNIALTRMKKKTNLSIVIPVSNEAKIISKQLNKIKKLISGTEEVTSYEVVVVENGSTDSTWDILSSEINHHPLKLLRLKKASYGSAIIHGLLYAKHETCLLMPIDWLDETFFRSGIKMLLDQESISVIVGDKNHPLSSSSRRLWPELLSSVWSLLQKIAFPELKVDSHGLKIIKLDAESKRKLLQLVTRDEYVEAEWLALMQSSGKKIISHPVRTFEIRQSNYALSKKMQRVIKDVIRLTLLLISGISRRENVKLICDDFGMAHHTSLRMLDLVKGGVIDGVSILATHSHPALLRLIPRQSHSISWHLNLTEGVPVSKPARVKSLVNKNDSFYPYHIFLLRIIFGLIKVSEIEEEIMAQHRALKKGNVSVNHSAGHWHIHLIPKVNRILKSKYPELQQRSVDSILCSLAPNPIRWLIFMTIIMPYQILSGMDLGHTQTEFEYVVHLYE